MAMKRTGTPWMKAEDFGRSLTRPDGYAVRAIDAASRVVAPPPGVGPELQEVGRG